MASSQPSGGPDDSCLTAMADYSETGSSPNYLARNAEGSAGVLPCGGY